MKNVKILIIGLGSIGKRHLKNLIYLGYNDIVLVRRNGLVLPDFPNLKTYATINKACENNNFTHVIISTPTSMHFDNFTKISKFEIKNIYIEKPITNEVDKAIEIEEITLNKNLNVSVGFDLHFDLGLNKVKDLLEKGIVGNVCSFQVEVGQYLPDWRPNQDYRLGMSAKKELGGGVMLDLIHEFDYVNWLFGPIDSIFGLNTQISNLDIETEDVSINLVKTKKGVLGVVYLDYLQKTLSRNCKIVGDNGSIFWNYKESTVEWFTHKNQSVKKFEYKDYERNNRFISILKSFMESSLTSKDSRLSNIENSIKSLNLVSHAKESNINNKNFKL
jgi:predicted dehydrogenase